MKPLQLGTYHGYAYNLSTRDAEEGLPQVSGCLSYIMSPWPARAIMRPYLKLTATTKITITKPTK